MCKDNKLFLLMQSLVVNGKIDKNELKCEAKKLNVEDKALSCFLSALLCFRQ